MNRAILEARDAVGIEREGAVVRSFILRKVRPAAAVILRRRYSNFQVADALDINPATVQAAVDRRRGR